MMAGKLHHVYICLGKRKQTGKCFCRMMDSGVSVCSKKKIYKKIKHQKSVCGDLEELKNTHGYR